MAHSFGSQIRERRKERGYTLRQLAPLLGINFAYLSKLENDRADHPPSEELIRQIAKTLELDQDKLIYLAGRITQSDAKMIEDLVKNNPEEACILFRKMKENPNFANSLFGKLENLIQ